MTTNTILTDQLLREMLERRAARGRVDGLLAEIVKAATVTPQRRSLVPRILVPSTWRPSLVLVPLVLVVAVLGALLIAPRNPEPGATPRPSPSVTPVPATFEAGGLDGPTLPAGRYSTSGFQPTLAFTVPDRVWTPVLDADRQLLLRARLPGIPASENTSLTLVTITNVYENACAEGAVRSVPWTSGANPGAFLDWLEREMSFDFGPRTERTILGRPSLQVDFSQPTLFQCMGASLAITDAGPVNPFGSNPSGQTSRYAVFELNGQTVLVGTWTTDPARRDVVWAAADAVLESLEIAP
jgi:hypothetical protein